MDVLVDWRWWLVRKIMLIWIKSNLILKKYLVTNLSIIKDFSKTKLKSYFNDATDFHDKEMYKVGSNHTCLAVISWNSSLEKDKSYYPQVFLKKCNIMKKKRKWFVIWHMIWENLLILMSVLKNSFFFNARFFNKISLTFLV